MRRIFSADRKHIESRNNEFQENFVRNSNYFPGFKFVDLNSSVKDNFYSQFDTTHFLSKELNSMNTCCSEQDNQDDGQVRYSREY